jgi:organic hydroperoxide reductase OsmC/OhrA
MNISARVTSRRGEHQVTLATDGNAHAIAIPPKPSGYGSSANGGELLLLALATCYCNDIYREAAKRGVQVAWVEVEVLGDFGREGEPGTNLTYPPKSLLTPPKTRSASFAGTPTVSLRYKTRCARPRL